MVCVVAEMEQVCQSHEADTKPSLVVLVRRTGSYSRRNKFNPLWNEVLVAGFKDGKPFLGQVSVGQGHARMALSGKSEAGVTGMRSLQTGAG